MIQRFTDGPIIYINDDEDDQFLFTQVIRELGYANPIRSFLNGEDALNYLQVTTDKPLLILCDVHMPQMSGLELRQQIDHNEPLQQKATPFVFYTTEASPAIIKQAYEGNIQGFHIKEQSYSDLKQQIQLIVTYWQACKHPNSVSS